MFSLNKKISTALLVGALSVTPFVAFDGAREAPTQVTERSSEPELAYRNRNSGRRYGRRGYRRGGYRGGYRYRTNRYYRSPYYYNYGPDYYYYNRGYNRAYYRPQGGITFGIRL